MKKSRLKVMTIVGTRPEIIRLSRVISRLDQYMDHTLVHTGQNYDYELNEIFFKDLGLREPDQSLDVDTSTLGSAVGDIIRKSEAVLKEVSPDALLVPGDTNSCLSAYMAKRLKIPVFHMEAGNRCFDFNVPEELNRRIYLTGSPMKEVLDHYHPKITGSSILSDLGLAKKQYFMASIHREENVDNPAHMHKILEVLTRLTTEYNLPVIVSSHPRTRKRLEENGINHPTDVNSSSSKDENSPSGPMGTSSPGKDENSPSVAGSGENAEDRSSQGIRFLKPFLFFVYATIHACIIVHNEFPFDRFLD